MTVEELLAILQNEDPAPIIYIYAKHGQIEYPYAVQISGWATEEQAAKSIKGSCAIRLCLPKGRSSRVIKDLYQNNLINFMQQ
jgi:hypothetical protein